MPDFLAPMLARLSTAPPEDGDWAFEIKWDGVRAIARLSDGRLQLLTRNRNDVSSAYPELSGLAQALSSHSAILDGEIVALDAQGRPSFQTLQKRMHVHRQAEAARLAKSAPVTYMIFDLLWLDGRSLIDLQYSQRRQRLSTLVSAGEHWRVPRCHVGEGDRLLQLAREQGLEGVIAKRLRAAYAPGHRDGSWLKVKAKNRQELLIGGWTEGKGARSDSIGALQLGVHDEHGHLLYAGKVGTGFDEKELQMLQGRLASLARRDSPFAGEQPTDAAHFVEPRLVCEVEFGEWTRQGRLRHPVYLGLREDKPAAEVVRERALPPPAAQNGWRHTAALRSPRQGRSGEIELEGRRLKLTNLDKPIYPKTGFTKGDLIDFYLSIAPVLLPHLQDRPLTVERYPDGVEGKSFFEKQSPSHRPAWVQTAPIWSEHSKREVRYTLCNDAKTLAWLSNLAAIDLHPSLSQIAAMQRPTALVLDLDPGPPAGLLACCEVALKLRDALSQLGIESFVKTSGSKGLQVYVPLNDEQVYYEQTKPFAHALARTFERREPKLVVSEMAKSKRRGKVLIDWSQNDEHKTTICVYSLRARDRPAVSTPVSWKEVQECAEREDESLLAFEADEVIARVERLGDLFADVLEMRQRLPRLKGG